MGSVGGLGHDFVEWLGPDTSACVFMLLDDPADLVRADAVSRSWHRFVIGNDFSKMLCTRICPEVVNFVRIDEASDTSVAKEDVGSSAAAEWERQRREHRVYMHLSHCILSADSSQDCIFQCIGASSTDNFPEESIVNTLEPNDRVELRPSYWSSGGQVDPGVPECLVYKLGADLCIVDGFKIQPFKAFFQYGDPVYSAKFVRLRMGYSKLPLGRDVPKENEEQLTSDDKYVWTYTSPVFPMLQENVPQSFELPRPVLCIGGIVKIELLGRMQRQTMDGLYYICVCHVQVLGRPLSHELTVDASDRGSVLKFVPAAARSAVDGKSPGNSTGGEDEEPSGWHAFAARLRHLGVAPVRGFNDAILNRIFGPAHPADEEDFVSDEEM